LPIVNCQLSSLDFLCKSCLLVTAVFIIFINITWNFQLDIEMCEEL